MGGILMCYDEYKHHGAIICMLSHVVFFFFLDRLYFWCVNGFKRKYKDPRCTNLGPRLL